MHSPIERFVEVDDLLATAAQPGPEGIAWLRERGFDAVVNLSTPTARNFVHDEARLVMEAGMAYVHAPVDCSRLEPAHYEVLRGVLDAFRARKVLVHCAGNVKSSALVALHRHLARGEPLEPILAALRAQGWHEPKWYEYLERMAAAAVGRAARAESSRAQSASGGSEADHPRPRFPGGPRRRKSRQSMDATPARSAGASAPPP